MDTREVAEDYRLTQWAQMIQARAQSGRSIKEFCASAGISRNAYFYWQRKLREAACAEMHAMASETTNDLIPNGWKQLETIEAKSTEASVTIEVSGCRITTTAETNLELLANICRALRSL